MTSIRLNLFSIIGQGLNCKHFAQAHSSGLTTLAFFVLLGTWLHTN